MKKKCPNCNEYLKTTQKSKLKELTYCSKCKGLLTNKEKHWHWNGGKPKCLECGKELSAYHVKYCSKHRSINNTGEKSYQWKGDNVGYHGLHKWVERQLGKPKKCEHCHTIDETKRYEWANKNYEYKRVIEDWIRLCRKCHGQFDKGENWGIAYKKFGIQR